MAGYILALLTLIGTWISGFIIAYKYDLTALVPI